MLTKLHSSLINLCLIGFSQCQPFEQEVTPREQRGYISVNEDAYMESFRSSLSEGNSRTQESDINWNEIYRVYDPEHDLTTYTLYKRSNTPNTFDNLVVLKKQDQENTYTIRYKPNPAWLKGKRLLNHLESFTGRVEFLSSDGEMISGLNYVNGVSELEKKKATGRLQDCETVYEIHWTESCAEGGDCVGGENITIYEWQICDLPGPSEPDGDEIIDGGPSTGGGGTGIGGGNPGLNDNDDIEECPLGGILDSNGNCIQERKLEEIMRCEELSDDQLNQLEDVLDEYLTADYLTTCLNNQVFDYVVNKNVKFCFKMGTQTGAPGEYMSSSTTISFKSDSEIKEGVFGEEFFHAYQDIFYGGLPTNTGRSNIEFEAKLFHDISHGGMCCIMFFDGAIRVEYENWLREITDWYSKMPSWSDMSRKYYYFMEKFTEVKPSYDYPIDYSQKPEAIFNLNDCIQ